MATTTQKSKYSADGVKGFPAGDKNAKIVSSRGRLRVVTREYYWDKKKRRGLEKRAYIGYVVDNEYFDNEAYKTLFKRSGNRRVAPLQQQAAPVSDEVPMASLETLLAGEFPLYYAVAEKTGLLEDLTAVWGEQSARVILSVAFHWLHTEHNAAYLYESWSPGKLLPFKGNITSKEMTEFFNSLLSVPGWRKTFFGARAARLPEDEMLSFDATEIASEAQEMSYAQRGKGKEGGYQKQVGLIVLMGHRTKMPVLFRVLPGNISDVTTVTDMLFRFDEITDKKRVFAAVLDRGYCSMDNIARFIDKNSRVIIASKSNCSWARESIDKVMSDLWMSEFRIPGKSCWGTTVAVDKAFPDGKKRRFWVHVYRSDAMSHIDNEDFFKDIEAFEADWNGYRSEDDPKGTRKAALKKSQLLKYFEKARTPGRQNLKRNVAALDEATRYFGFFCNVTTFECSATDALIEYATRDVIEKGFKAGKSYADMGVLRAHSDETSEGRFVISFSCVTILSYIYARMRMPTLMPTGKGTSKELNPLIKDMTFGEVKNYLTPIRMAFDGKGGRRWLEVTNKQHNIARRLGFPDLYKELPNWEPK